MKKRILWLATMLVSLVFIAAGLTKFASPESLASQMQALKLPLTVTFPWLALWLPGLEILLGVALWFRSWRLASWLGILPLTVMFTAVLGWALWKGLNVSCGCFGDVLHFSLQAAIGRNVLILVIGVWSLCRMRD